MSDVNKPENLPPANKKPFYKGDPFSTILAALAVFLLSQIVAGILLSIYPLTQNWSDIEISNWLNNSIFPQFTYVLIAEFLAIYLIFRLIRSAGVTHARIGLVKPKLQDIVYALLGYGLYFLAYLVVIILTTNLIPGLNVEQKQEVGFEQAYGTLQLVMTFISLVILPPLAEELIFRGYLYTSLRTKYRMRIAVIVTSSLFGIAHLQLGSSAPLLWVAAIDTFVLSVVLCILRERSGSLWPAIYLHAIKNLVAFMILFGARLAIFS